MTGMLAEMQRGHALLKKRQDKLRAALKRAMEMNLLPTTGPEPGRAVAVKLHPQHREELDEIRRKWCIRSTRRAAQVVMLMGLQIMREMEPRDE